VRERCCDPVTRWRQAVLFGTERKPRDHFCHNDRTAPIVANDVNEFKGGDRSF
jgi:hypothetical protein